MKTAAMEKVIDQPIDLPITHIEKIEIKKHYLEQRRHK